MAVDRYSLNGCAFIYTAKVGQSFSLLGYTEQGADMVISEAKEEIMTDLMGTKTPQDFQNMGALANIIAPMIAYDTQQLRGLITYSNATFRGDIGTPGMVYGINNLYFSLYIASAYDNPWYFPYCLLRQSGTRLATKVNPYRLEVIAWPYQNLTSTDATEAELFARTIP